jgi:hypothetical protein
MKNPFRYCLSGVSILSLCLASLSASEMTVKIHPFSIPGTFNFVDSDVGFLFSEMASAGAENNATHMLIEGLIPIEAGSNIVASSYKAIDLSSGSIQDVGMVMLTLPAGAQPPSGSVASPIVGIVQRQGAWSNFNPSPVTSTTVGASQGAGNYDAAAGTLQLSLSRNSETFTGSTTYSVVNINTIEMDAFTLTSGSSNFGFEASTLVRDQSRFYGTLLASDSSVGYDSLLFSIEFVNIPDVNGDGIPDIVDPFAQPGLNLVAGQWTHHGGIGNVYGVTADWAFSPYVGFFNAASFPRIYTANHGWMTFISRMQTNYVWLHSPSLGWVFADVRQNGRFRANPAGTGWQDFNFFQSSGIN